MGMKQSKTTMKELTRRYRAVLIKCALLNLAAFAVALPAKAEDVVIGDGDTATYTRVAKEGQNNRYTIKVNNNAEEFFNFSPAALKMTGGNLIVESKVGDWLDWQGTGGIDISGGTVSARNEETLSTYRGALSISGNAVINTAMMSDTGVTISGGKITLADTNDANKELYFGKGLGIDAADEQTSGTLSISGGDITLGKNRYIVLLREWGDDDTENLPASYRGDIKISGGNITLNQNAQIIRTDNDNDNYLKDSRPNELFKTTGEIDISGGTVTLNNTAAIVNHSSDGTIRISDTAVINVNGNNRFENAKGIATADFTGGTINLNGTLTADINATGGSLTVNKNGNLNGNLSGTLNDLTIAGGELSVKAPVQTASFIMTNGHLTIRGTNKDHSEDGSLWSSTDNDMTFKGGTVDFTKRIDGGTDHIRHTGAGNIDISGGIFNGHNDNEFVHIGNGNVKISGGTFNSVAFIKPRHNENGVYGFGGNIVPKGKIEISGGVFNNAELNSDGSDGISISNGTFSDSSIAANNGDLNITGGSFKDNDLEGKDVNISGGTFNNWMNIDASKEYAESGKLNITGGDFSKLTFLEMYGKNIAVDSDKANFALSANKMSNEIEASEKLTVTGEKGVSVAKTIVSAPEISGKIIANGSAFIGGFGGSLDNWKGNYRVVDDAFGIDTKLNNADITLNADAKAGTGDVIWGINSMWGNVDPNANVTLRLNNQKQLTEAEINIAVNEILADLKRVEAKTKDLDDLTMFANDAIEVPYSGTLEYYQEPELQSYIQEQWEQNKELDYDLVEKTLRDAYAAYNGKVSEFSAQVKVVNSAITMNGASGLVNGSAKDGNITVSGSTITANGRNDITAKSGKVSLDTSDLIVSNGATLDVFTSDGDTLNLTNSTIDLSGALNANVKGGTVAFNSAAARLNGTVSGTTINVNTNLALSALPTGLTTLNIADGKTLDIGTGTLTADLISGGTISAILTDAAQTSAIVNATAKNATLKLDMSNASRDAVTEYKITNGSGFTFGEYATNRFAVSSSNFDIADAKTIGALENWNGGNLYILRLATAAEASIEDLEAAGVKLPENEKQASKILDLANEVLDKLPEHTQKIIEKVNDMLDAAAGKTAEVRQILKEVAPDAAQSGAKTATSTAKSVINVVGSRFGGGVKSGGSFRGRGRSGGDYAAGRSSVWAQGMMNYAKLDKEDGFNAHSNGFAAGAEVNFTDSFKAGIGYAYTAGDISTDRAQTDVDTHTGFVYGEYKPHQAYVNGVVSYGRSKYDEKTRTVGLTSDYNADTIAAQIAAGYDFGLLTPEAAVRFTNVRLKEYTDAAGATLRDKTQNTWTGVAGIKAAKGYHLTANPKINFTPELKVAATYDFARDDENRTVVLPDHSSYVASGDPMKRFGVETGAGLTVAFGNTSELSVSYEGKFKDHYKDHTGMINLKVNF